MFFFCLALCSNTLGDKHKLSSLPPAYRQLIERDTAYIMSAEERDAFFALKTDEERDKFIENFWQSRNPTPGAPGNSYKEEIYQRIEYANQYFAARITGTGWRTDRGRVYITLGPPQQRAKYYNTSQARPMEIWFYQNTNPALPSYFYLIFYQRDIGRDFILYSPYFDGPDKLTTSSFAIGNAAKAVDLIDREFGREVARTTLSLIPNEPVDLTNATRSLSSDVMLSTLKTLADNPLTKAQWKLGRDLLTNVSSLLILPGDHLNVLAVTLRDPDGSTNLHYALRLSKPGDFAVGKEKDRYFYNLEVSVQVFDDTDHLLLGQVKNVAKYLGEEEFSKLKGRAIGYEDVLPLPPGKFKLKIMLTNKVSKTAFRTEKLVEVPPPPRSDIKLSGVFAFTTAEQATGRAAPFTSAGVRFTPRLGEELTIPPGQDLKLAYQVWIPPSPLSADRGKPLKVEYAFGRPAVQSDVHTLQEEIKKEQFDIHGSLVTGKKISTANLVPGNYRLAITVTDSDSGQKAFTSFSFRVGGEEAPPGIDLAEDAGNSPPGTSESMRATVYASQGNFESANEWMRKALDQDPNNEEYRSHLADHYFYTKEYSSVVKLYAGHPVSEKTPDQTVLHLAQSISNIGNMNEASKMLEAVLNQRKGSAPLYLILADFYEKQGRVREAKDLRDRAGNLDQ